MAQEDLRATITLIAKLNKPELSKAKIAINARLGSNRHPNKNAHVNQQLEISESDIGLLFTIFRKHLELTGKSPGPIFEGFLKLNAAKTYLDNYKLLDAYLNKWFLGINKVNKIKLFRLFAQLLDHNFEELAIPVTVNLMAKHVDKIPALMEREFPGYAASGMLHLLIESQPRKLPK